MIKRHFFLQRELLLMGDDHLSMKVAVVSGKKDVLLNGVMKNDMH